MPNHEELDVTSAFWYHKAQLIERLIVAIPVDKISTVELRQRTTTRNLEELLDFLIDQEGYMQLVDPVDDHGRVELDFGKTRLSPRHYRFVHISKEKNENLPGAVFVTMVRERESSASEAPTIQG